MDFVATTLFTMGAALTWRNAFDHPVVRMTFDRRLWEASGLQGLESWPPDLPGLLEDWTKE